MDAQREINAVRQGYLFDEREQPGRLAPEIGVAGGEAEDRGRESVVDRMVVVSGQADLLEIVHALNPAGRLTRRLYRGQQQCYEHGDDCYHDQQLDQCKTVRPET